jgi:hypothetical protein
MVDDTYAARELFESKAEDVRAVLAVWRRCDRMGFQEARLAVLVDGLHREEGTTVRIDQNNQQGARKENLEATGSRDRAGAFSCRLARRANDIRRAL